MAGVRKPHIFQQKFDYLSGGRRTFEEFTKDLINTNGKQNFNLSHPNMKLLKKCGNVKKFFKTNNEVSKRLHKNVEPVSNAQFNSKLQWNEAPIMLVAHCFSLL